MSYFSTTNTYMAFTMCRYYSRCFTNIDSFGLHNPVKYEHFSDEKTGMDKSTRLLGGRAGVQTSAAGFSDLC